QPVDTPPIFLNTTFVYISAQHAPGKDLWWRGFYQRISKSGKKIARVAVARKLLEIIYRIWKEEKPYYKKGTVALHVV
ncbi:MAG TPA: hypothetical protein P5294_10645, partial [Smithellaceae bacterium]|nr:hypothetical protein [Smithellaceae bacterium]HRS90119.1 hypothetical protein [Smithellaceae bacterium]HRV26988.1 hypothetical protein [Smithellaceae bacterium]